MSRLQLILFLAPPVIAVIYALLEHFGQLDRWTGRRLALEGLRRLQSAAGYPVSFLYDDPQDANVFRAVEKRITRKTKLEVRDGNGKIVRPTGICIVGNPFPLQGVPGDWPQEQRFVYTEQHPVLYMFGAKRIGGGGKAHRVCSLGELEKWLSEEKEARKHWVGAIAIGFISMALIVLRLSVSS